MPAHGTASVTVGCVALALALKKIFDHEIIRTMPLHHLVAGASVGIVRGEPRLDLEYIEDSRAEIE